MARPTRTENTKANLATTQTIRTVTGTTLELADDVDRDSVVAALVPIKAGSIAERARAMQRMLETPFVSARALAQNGAIIELLNVAESQIQKIGAPEGEMVEQYVFMATLQTPLSYVDAAQNVREYERGDVILVGQAKNKVRDMWADLVRAAAAEGETIPNVQPWERPNKKPGLAPSVSFRQLEV